MQFYKEHKNLTIKMLAFSAASGIIYLSYRLYEHLISKTRNSNSRKKTSKKDECAELVDKETILEVLSQIQEKSSEEIFKIAKECRQNRRRLMVVSEEYHNCVKKHQQLFNKKTQSVFRISL